MHEIIVRLCRAIASRPRLRILSRLAKHGEAIPTVLQHELRLPLNVVSHHLRTLASVGLISGRRSAARCYYEFRSRYPKNTLSGDMSAWLRDLLRSAPGATSGEVKEAHSPSAPPSDAKLHTVIFEAATAFTDLRRVQVLDYLGTHAQASGATLAAQLKMSEFAVSRQTTKLRRRGILLASREGMTGLVFQLAAHSKTPIHGRMLRIVRSALQKETLRTS